MNVGGLIEHETDEELGYDTRNDDAGDRIGACGLQQ